jgi:4-carboxymuconolactone decarboxylase
VDRGLGGAEPQLATHIRGALNVDVTPTEILETLFHIALYAGIPRAINGLRVASETLTECGIDHTSLDTPAPDAEATGQAQVAATTPVGEDTGPR